MDSEQADLIIDWTPVRKDESSSGADTLRKISDDRLEFIPSPGHIVILFIVSVSGLIALTPLFYMTHHEVGFYVSLVLGSVFFIVGIYLLFVSNNRVIFKNTDDGWRISKSNVFSKTIKFSLYKPMYAVQVLRKDVDSSDSYELNIVYKDGSRENILSQIGPDSVIKDATLLSESLKLPFLNGVKVGQPISIWGEFKPFQKHTPRKPD